MELTVKEYQERFTGDNLEQLLEVAKTSTDSDAARELPKIQEALEAKKAADDAEAAKWREEHGEIFIEAADGEEAEELTEERAEELANEIVRED